MATTKKTTKVAAKSASAPSKAAPKKSTKKATKTPAKAAAKEGKAPREVMPVGFVQEHPLKLDGPAGPIARFREICLGLPESTELLTWGHPTFRVRDKIFASAGAENGVWSLGMKTTHEMQAGLVASDPRFSIAAYVGKHGWINLRVDETIDWEHVRALVVGSYRMIAPKTLAGRVTA